MILSAIAGEDCCHVRVSTERLHVLVGHYNIAQYGLCRANLMLFERLAVIAH